MTYKAVLFDMDGTLLDTLSDLALSANRMLESRDFPVHSVDAYRYFVGAGAANLVTQVLPEANRDEETINDCLRQFLIIYDSSWKDNTRLYPGIDRMLDYLQDKGYRLNILSNKPQDFTEKCTKEFLSRWPFEEIWGKREGFKVKPDPQSALKIAETLGLQPAECFYLGDTSIDMKTATRSGMFPAGVLWGFRTKAELLESGARAILENPADIKQYL